MRRESYGYGVGDGGNVREIVYPMRWLKWYPEMVERMTRFVELYVG